ncbi:hypothetical protein IJH02_02530 [Candidatus Saccharibacteria bacterium]|nr:hypothetical protein [Candidatus Saccharibacteria bacterium]
MRQTNECYNITRAYVGYPIYRIKRGQIAVRWIMNSTEFEEEEIQEIPLRGDKVSRTKVIKRYDKKGRLIEKLFQAL